MIKLIDEEFNKFRELVLYQIKNNPTDIGFELYLKWNKILQISWYDDNTLSILDILSLNGFQAFSVEEFVKLFDYNYMKDDYYSEQKFYDDVNIKLIKAGLSEYVNNYDKLILQIKTMITNQSYLEEYLHI